MRHTCLGRLILGGGVLALAACGQAHAEGNDAPLLFKEITEEAGIHWPDCRLAPGAKEKPWSWKYPKWPSERWDGYHLWLFSVAFIDVDGDGMQDVFAVGHNGGDGLFLNKGGGKFLPNCAQRSYAASEPPAHEAHGSCFPAIADVNGDGRLDWVVTSAAVCLNRGLRGAGDARSLWFTLLRAPKMGGARHALLSDLNGDGILDIVRTSEIRFGNGQPVPRGWARAHALPRAHRFAALDFDRDGHLDLMTVSRASKQQGGRPTLHRNDGKGGFADKTDALGVGSLPTNGLLLVADFNNDGYEDLFGYGLPSLLAKEADRQHLRVLLNQGGKTFRDVTAGSGLPFDRPYAWPIFYCGATVADLDNDGLVDMVVVLPAKRGLAVNVCRNRGNGKFQLTHLADHSGRGSSNYASAADIDGDGILEIACLGGKNGIRLFRNVSRKAKGNGWLEVEAVGPEGNRTGIGSLVEVFERGHLGDRTKLAGMRRIRANSMMGSLHRAHFGLGKRQSVDVRVTFPGGKAAEAGNVKARTVLSVSIDGKVGLSG